MVRPADEQVGFIRLISPPIFFLVCVSSAVVLGSASFLRGATRLQLRDHGFDFIELAVWRVLRLLASIADELALVVRRDFAVAAKRSRWAFVTWILPPRSALPPMS
jgi:hypothetical protein